MRVTLADQPGITPQESRELGSALSESLIATLEKLTRNNGGEPPVAIRGRRRT